MTHEEKNIGGRAEHPGSDEQKISQMLGSLKRVEAPKDFDFHLKARIANAKPSDYQRSGLFPVLKYAMPLALFLVVGAGAVGISSYNGWQAPTAVVNPQVPTESAVKQSEPEMKAAAVPSPVSETLPVMSGENPEEREPRRVASNPETNRVQRRATPKAPVRAVPTPGGGSIDLAVRNGSRDARCNPNLPCEPLAAQEALNRLGVEVKLEGGAWTVKSVKANNVAGQLGVKPGDKLKSIDGLPLTERSTFDNVLTIKTIQVQRGKETIDLTINDKPK